MSLAKSLPVYVYSRSTGELMGYYPGVREASKALHICNKTIKKYIVSGTSYKGMLFSYSSI
jgi:hypothetical protein